jgi:hypothetical protein
VDNLRLQVKASDAQINELKIKIQELNNQLEANKQEMKSLAKRVASEQEETSTIISSLNLERSEMGAYVAYASVEASELHQEQEDSISQDFDQQDQIHSAIEKFEVSSFIFSLKTFNPVFHTGALVHHHFECQYLLK